MREKAKIVSFDNFIFPFEQSLLLMGGVLQFFVSQLLLARSYSVHNKGRYS